MKYRLVWHAGFRPTNTCGIHSHYPANVTIMVDYQSALISHRGINTSPLPPARTDVRPIDSSTREVHQVEEADKVKELGAGEKDWYPITAEPVLFFNSRHGLPL
jgi:hypothetical protein